MLKGEISLGKEVQSITCLGTTKLSKELDVTEVEGVLNLKSFLLREASREDRAKAVFSTMAVKPKHRLLILSPLLRTSL